MSNTEQWTVGNSKLDRATVPTVGRWATTPLRLLLLQRRPRHLGIWSIAVVVVAVIVVVVVVVVTLLPPLQTSQLALRQRTRALCDGTHTHAAQQSHRNDTSCPLPLGSPLPLLPSSRQSVRIPRRTLPGKCSSIRQCAVGTAPRTHLPDRGVQFPCDKILEFLGVLIVVGALPVVRK